MKKSALFSLLALCMAFPIQCLALGFPNEPFNNGSMWCACRLISRLLWMPTIITVSAAIFSQHSIMPSILLCNIICMLFSTNIRSMVRDGFPIMAKKLSLRAFASSQSGTRTKTIRWFMNSSTNPAETALKAVGERCNAD